MGVYNNIGSMLHIEFSILILFSIFPKPKTLKNFLNVCIIQLYCTAVP